MKQAFNFLEGEFLLIHKPSGWTSFDVVNKVRFILKHHAGISKIKVGHAGTLDPLATGLLMVCVGKATKRINEFTGLDKEYTGTFYLGATTPSYDMETEVDKVYNTSHITPDQIKNTANQFIGNIKQIPPVFSAIKVGGTRAYKMARANESVSMPPREVSIHEFEITNAAIPETSFRVLCSKGTYVRSLAYDFGKSLKSGAYIKSLRRTRIGNYRIEEAVSLPELEEIIIRQLDK